jgi:hypothetical protein
MIVMHVVAGSHSKMSIRIALTIPLLSAALLAIFFRIH